MQAWQEGHTGEALHKHGSQGPAAAAERAPAAALQGWSKPPARLGWAAPQSARAGQHQGMACIGDGISFASLKFSAEQGLCYDAAVHSSPQAGLPLPCWAMPAANNFPTHRLPPAQCRAPAGRQQCRSRPTAAAGGGPRNQPSPPPALHTGGLGSGHCGQQVRPKLRRRVRREAAREVASGSEEGAKPTCHDELEKAKDQRHPGGLLCA